MNNGIWSQLKENARKETKSKRFWVDMSEYAVFFVIMMLLIATAMAYQMPQSSGFSGGASYATNHEDALVDLMRDVDILIEKYDFDEVGELPTDVNQIYVKRINDDECVAAVYSSLDEKLNYTFVGDFTGRAVVSDGWLMMPNHHVRQVGVNAILEEELRKWSTTGLTVRISGPLQEPDLDLWIKPLEPLAVWLGAKVDFDHYRLRCLIYGCILIEIALIVGWVLRFMISVIRRTRQ